MLVNSDFKRNIALPALIALLAVLLLPSVSELVVAIFNKYSVYPTGEDTNMLGQSLMVQAACWFMLLGAMLYYWKVRDIRDITVAVLIGIGLIFVLIFFVHIPSFVPDSWCDYKLKIYSCEDLDRQRLWLGY